MNIRIATMLLCAAAICAPATGNAVSPKRGLCWDEEKTALNEHHAWLLEPGVSWVYNWGAAPKEPEVYTSTFCFVPMAWNASYDAAAIRRWLAGHPETRWLLGFNEPNFADQARMTPAQAAAAWPGLEAIAEEYGVGLVAPALNFSASQVGGKVWGIYEWYDEFFRLRPDARIDCLALHCYMNWHPATTWFATEYFYKDLYDPSNENYGKYPHLVKFLDTYRESNGHFPRMMLTEFCGWEYDYLPDVYFQIDQMTQKVQALELSDLVEGYAWFMGNADGGAGAFPYMSVFQSNTVTSGLSELGEVYVNMSAFDLAHFYLPGEEIAAKDYVDASTDEEQVKVRRNTDSASDVALQIQFPAGGWSEYLIEVPEDGPYTFVLHGKASPGSTLSLSFKGAEASSVSGETVSAASTSGESSVGCETVEVPITYRGDAWTETEAECTMTAGRHRLRIRNTGKSAVTLNALRYVASSHGAVDNVFDDGVSGSWSGEDASGETGEVYNAAGVYLGHASSAPLAPGLYILRRPDGTSVKIRK